MGATHDDRADAERWRAFVRLSASATECPAGGAYYRPAGHNGGRWATIELAWPAEAWGPLTKEAADAAIDAVIEAGEEDGTPPGS